MTALNTVNGIPATANPFTLGRVLRGEWRFDGLIVSDYKAVKQLVPHGMAADESEAARLALLAGIDMEEESARSTSTARRLVGDGKVPIGADRRGGPACPSRSSAAWGSSTILTPMRSASNRCS